MSRHLGSALPAKLVAELDKDKPPLRAVGLVSIDPDGFPHAALLSYFELVHLQGRLLFFMGASSRSASYLAQRASCTLLFVDSDFVYYVKCLAEYLSESNSQAVFQTRVIAVLEDAPSSQESGSVLQSGIRFSEDVADSERRLRLRDRVMAAIGDR